MQRKRKHIKPLKIKEKSGFSPKPGSIQFAKKHNYFIERGFAITGDAPKDFVRFYHYGNGLKRNVKTWNLYIAKLGHKHYPMESITEQLLTRIGEVYGFNLAESELAWMGGQIRFLSKYFIRNRNDHVLDHGADLYAGYLNDKEFVEQVEKQKESKHFFTVEFTHEVLKHFFADDHKEIFDDFLDMLLFDALIGNNDRHFYNWAIVRSISGREKPVFSPIYDTARGLFWNDHETKIIKANNEKSKIDSFIEKYCKKSQPKISFEGAGNSNHFDLMESIVSSKYNLKHETIDRIFTNNIIHEVIKIIDTEFKNLISKERRHLIRKCLEYRYYTIKNIIS